MKAYVESALDNPQVVGVHGHQFSDQAPSSIRAVRGLDGEAWLSLKTSVHAKFFVQSKGGMVLLAI